MRHLFARGMTKRNLGRGTFDVFPEQWRWPRPGNGIRNLRASLNNVLETRRADAMAVQSGAAPNWRRRIRRAILDPCRLAGCFSAGSIIHRVETVTEFVRLRQVGREREQATQALKSRADQMEAEIYERAQQVAEANRQLASLYRQIELLMVRAEDAADQRWEDGHKAIAPDDMLARQQLLVDHSRLEDP